jgi:hypothetical protein
MRVSVQIYPVNSGTSRTEAVTFDMPCGTGDQLIRWLGQAACLRLAYEKRDIATRFVPQAVLSKDGVVLDADHVIKEVHVLLQIHAMPTHVLIEALNQEPRHPNQPAFSTDHC